MNEASRKDEGFCDVRFDGGDGSSDVTPSQLSPVKLLNRVAHCAPEPLPALEGLNSLLGDGQEALFGYCWSREIRESLSEAVFVSLVHVRPLRRVWC